LLFYDSYKEIQRFKKKIDRSEPSYELSGFTQYIVDNADFNVTTLTGHNTFHTMGSIACATPSGSGAQKVLKHSTELKNVEFTESYGNISVKYYKKPKMSGLKSVIIGPLETPKTNIL